MQTNQDFIFLNKEYKKFTIKIYKLFIAMFFLLLWLARSKTDRIDHFLRSGINYYTLNESQGLSHKISTSFFSKTLVAIIQQTNNAKITFVSPTNVTAKSVVIAKGNEIRVDFTKTQNNDGIVTLAFSELSKLNCQDYLVIRNDHFETNVTLPHNTEVCYIYCPKGQYLRYNMKQSKVDTHFDSITIYRDSSNNAWYDRYETITSPSGWSAISNKPWLIRFKGSTGSFLSFELKAVVDKTQPGILTENEIPQEVYSYQFADIKSNIAIPIIGCVTPCLLIASWIYAYCKLFY